MPWLPRPHLKWCAAAGALPLNSQSSILNPRFSSDSPPLAVRRSNCQLSIVNCQRRESSAPRRRMPRGHEALLGRDGPQESSSGAAVLVSAKWKCSQRRCPRVQHGPRVQHFKTWPTVPTWPTVAQHNVVGKNENVKNSPGLWPMACQIRLIPVFLFIKSSISLILGRCPGSPGPPNAQAGVRSGRKIRPRTLQGAIFIDFWAATERSKKRRIFDASRNRVRSSQNRPFGAQGSILDGKWAQKKVNF